MGNPNRLTDSFVVPGPNWWNICHQLHLHAEFPWRKQMKLKDLGMVWMMCFFHYSCHLENKNYFFSYESFYFGGCVRQRTSFQISNELSSEKKIRSKVPQGKFTATATSNVQPDLTTCHRLQIFLAFGPWLEWHQTYTRRRRLRNWSLLFFFRGKVVVDLWEKKPTFVCYEAHPDWQTMYCHSMWFRQIYIFHYFSFLHMYILYIWYWSVLNLCGIILWNLDWQWFFCVGLWRIWGDALRSTSALTILSPSILLQMWRFQIHGLPRATFVRVLIFTLTAALNDVMLKLWNILIGDVITDIDLNTKHTPLFWSFPFICVVVVVVVVVLSVLIVFLNGKIIPLD